MKDSLLADNTLALKLLIDSPVYVLKQDITAPLSNEASITESVNTEKITPFKGGFAKKLLFVISGDNLTLSDNDWDLFNKTIAALKLSVDDLAIIENTIESPIDLLSVITELKPNKTIVFGKVNLSDATSTSILRCETLKALSENKDLKIEWWNSLKAYLS